MRPPDEISLQAARFYDSIDQGVYFSDAVFRCLTRGIIEKRINHFLMAERVTYRSGVILWNSDEPPNCWYIHWAGGKGLQKFWEAAKSEKPMEYFAWKKRGKLKVYTWEDWEKGSYGRRR